MDRPDVASKTIGCQLSRAYACHERRGHQTDQKIQRFMTWQTAKSFVLLSMAFENDLLVVDVLMSLHAMSSKRPLFSRCWTHWHLYHLEYYTI